MSEKLSLIGKPCQSGKTTILIEFVIELVNDDEEIQNNIAVLFCDNSLLQTGQLGNRVDNNNLEKEIMSSKSEIRDFKSLHYEIDYNDLKIVICCCNSTQVNNISRLLKDYSERNPDNLRFNIFIDEADKTMGGELGDIINEWNEYEIVSKIGFITATPEKILKKFEGIRLHSIEFSYERELYHKIDDSDIHIIDKQPDYDSYLHYIMTQFDFNDNTVLYCPGNVKICSHENVKNILLQYKFNVLILNSHGINIYYYNGNIKNIGKQDKEISVWLADMYNSDEYELKNNKFAITGHLSIGRGITFSSPQLMLTDCIAPIKFTDKSSGYQLIARMCGNTKQFPNYVRPRIFGYNNIINTSIEMQNKIIDLVESSYKNKDLNPLISIDDYNNINADEKYGIPIKFTFNNADVFNMFMDDINTNLNGKRLNDKSRNLIRNTFNNYSNSYQTVNINSNDDYCPFSFDENYNIKNIKIINKETKDNTKYPMNKINNYLQMKKRYKAEDKNCSKPGDCIVYIINDDFPDFPDKGTIFITFWQKPF
jgi:hypothetical protein